MREGSPTARRLERARRAAVDLRRMERAAAKAPGDGFADASAEARERCGAEVADADRAIWGAEGAVGPAAASILRLRYLDALTWRQVAAAVGMSPSRCRTRADAAMDLMDALGPGRVKDGDGDAT
ncbi:hypothetical protein [Caniella muris]|uniref:hypothetical protein n=1 Tax=Caniella muris TaxID=2941502 RepID=UPI00203B59DA|nr:hypothetical protein [Caniella muris]